MPFSLCRSWRPSPPKPPSFVSEFLLLYIGLYAIYPLYAAHSLMQLIHLFWWASLIPVLLGVGIASAIGFSIYQLAKAPHPFLTSGSATGHNAWKQAPDDHAAFHTCTWNGASTGGRVTLAV